MSAPAVLYAHVCRLPPPACSQPLQLLNQAENICPFGWDLPRISRAKRFKTGQTLDKYNRKKVVIVHPSATPTHDIYVRIY